MREESGRRKEEPESANVPHKIECVASVDSLCHNTINEQVRFEDIDNKTGNNCSVPLAMKTLFGYNYSVFAKNLTTNDDNNILIASGNLLSIYNYEYDTHSILQVHKNKILSMSVDTKGLFFVSSDMGEDSRTIIWDASKRIPIHVIFHFNGNGCPFVKLSPCGKYLLTVAEKHSNKETKLLSLWDWVKRRNSPDATLEINTDEYGCLKKVDFCMDNCKLLILTTEKDVVFLTYEDNSSKEFSKQKTPSKEKLYKKQICTRAPVIKTNPLIKKDSKLSASRKMLSNKDNNSKILVHKPKYINRINNAGLYLDSTYVRGTRLAITGTSSGNVIVWSDIGMKEHFYEEKPMIDKLNNRKNFLLQLCIDPHPIQLIYNVDSYVVTINSKGQIGFYNEKLIPVFKIDDMGTNSPVNISFNLTRRSDKHMLTEEEFAKAKKRLFFMKKSVGPEKTLLKRKCFKYEKTEPQDKKNQENLNAFVYDAGKHSKRRKIDKWKKVQDLVPCLNNSNQLFDVRDFIITTSKGDIMYVNVSHSNVYEVLRNIYQGVTLIITHPFYDCVCFATCYGKLFLLDYNTLLVVKERDLDLNSLIEEHSINPNDEHIIQAAMNIMSFKYSPDGRWILCGTELGYVWLLNGVSLNPEMRLKVSEFPILKATISSNSNLFAFCDKISQLMLYKLIKHENGRRLNFIFRIQAHTKPMTDAIFLPESGRAYLYSIAEDGYLMKYRTNDCVIGESSWIKDFVVIDEFDTPTCMVPAEDMPNTLLIFNDKLKCRMINTITMTILRTVQGPYSGPVYSAELINTRNYDDKFMLFAANNDIGIMKLPLDGNPFKITSHSAGGSKILSACTERDGKYAFSIAAYENIVMWDINIVAVNILETIGGKGINPYLLALKADPSCLVMSDMEALFRIAILSSEGIISIKPRVYQNTLPVIAVINFIRSLGFYPTLKESKDIICELLEGEEITASEKRVSFETCVKLFYNHKSERFSERMIQKAFENVCRKAKSSGVNDKFGISSETFAKILLSDGEKFTSCQLLNFLRSLVKPLKKEDELLLLMRNKLLEDTPEELLENKCFDFMPNVITYSYFKDVMLGIWTDEFHHDDIHCSC